MSIFLSLLLSCLLTTLPVHRSPQSTGKQWPRISEGIGFAGILIDRSTAADVVAVFGEKYSVITHNEYSQSMKYAELDLSFYYCLKDKQKRIFLIEVHHGTTSKGIVIGQSTLRDVSDLYGKEDDRDCKSSTSCVCVYKGVQFYVEGPAGKANEADVDPRQMKVVEVDVTSPDKVSNFCDGFEPAPGAASH